MADFTGESIYGRMYRQGQIVNKEKEVQNMKQECGNCRYYRKVPAMCRRNPPQVQPNASVLPCQPYTQFQDWCGEWKEDAPAKEATLADVNYEATLRADIRMQQKEIVDLHKKNEIQKEWNAGLRRLNDDITYQIIKKQDENEALKEENRVCLAQKIALNKVINELRERNAEILIELHKHKLKYPALSIKETLPPWFNERYRTIPYPHIDYKFTTFTGDLI